MVYMLCQKFRSAKQNIMTFLVKTEMNSLRRCERRMKLKMVISE